jgi:hypothetical protein
VAKAEDKLWLCTALDHQLSYSQFVESSSHYIAANIMNLHIIFNTFYQKIASTVTDLRDMSKRSTRRCVHQLLWYLLIPCLLVHQLLSYEDSIKHRRGPSLP